MAGTLTATHYCQSCINHKNNKETIIENIEKELTKTNIDQCSTQQESDKNSCDVNEMESSQLEATGDDYEIFIGNLRVDVERDVIIKKLQKLFTTAGVNLKESELTTLHHGPKKTKFLVANLKNKEEAQDLIKFFDGYEDAEIVAENKILKVCLKRDRPGRKRRKRKRRDSPAPDENENIAREDNVGNCCQGNCIAEKDLVKDAKENEVASDGTKIKEIIVNVRERVETEIASDNATKTKNLFVKYEEVFANEKKKGDETNSAILEGESGGIKNVIESETKTNNIAINCVKNNCTKDCERHVLKDTVEEKVDSDRRDMTFAVQDCDLKKIVHSTSMPNINMLEYFESKLKVLVTGQVLQNEDRRTEYKRGSGKYPMRYLMGDVRRYSCAFLNSEGKETCNLNFSVF